MSLSNGACPADQSKVDLKAFPALCFCGEWLDESGAATKLATLKRQARLGQIGRPEAALNSFKLLSL